MQRKKKNKGIFKILLFSLKKEFHTTFQLKKSCVTYPKAFICSYFAGSMCVELLAKGTIKDAGDTTQKMTDGTIPNN